MSKNNLELSRRKILSATAAVGVAAVGAGVGTSTLFSDEESFEDNTLTAGTPDLSVQANVYEYQGVANEAVKLSVASRTVRHRRSASNSTTSSPTTTATGRFASRSLTTPATSGPAAN